MQSMTELPRGPAPSRTAYRLQRLWLTPIVRVFMLAGLPLLIIASAGIWVVQQTQIVPATRAYMAELRRTIEERPEFMVKLMAIDGGADEVAEDIREILPIDFPVSSFDLDLEELRARIEELDAVASVSARIRTGGILQIDIVERIPAVVWRGPQGIELLDAEGHRVASLERRARRPDLPLIAGEGAESAVPEGLRLIALAAPFGQRLRGLMRVGERRWDLILNRDLRIMLPETGAALALEQIVALDQVHNLLARDVSVVDFRIPNRPTLRGTKDTMDYLRQISALGGGAATNE